MALTEFEDFMDRMFTASGGVKDECRPVAYYIRQAGGLELPPYSAISEELEQALFTEDGEIVLEDFFGSGCETSLRIIPEYNSLWIEEEFHISIWLAAYTFDEETWEEYAPHICEQSVGIYCSNDPDKDTVFELLHECYDKLCEGAAQVADDLINKTAEERNTIIYL